MTAWRVTSRNTGLTWADCARIALAQADAASLVTRPPGGDDRPTQVSLGVRPDGAPVMWVAAGSPALGDLATGRVVTLALPGHAPGWALHLVGTPFPLPDTRGPGSGSAGCDCRAYALALRGVRLVGPSRVSVPPDELRATGPHPATTPDPLRHLEVTHSADLLARVRGHGHDALAVVPRATDHRGLHVVALGADGVELLLLALPEDEGPEADGGGPAPLQHLGCRCGQPPTAG